MPGRIFEVIPTAVNVQAFANFGYLATNDATAVGGDPARHRQHPPRRNHPSVWQRRGGMGHCANTNQSILVANLLSVRWASNWTTNDTGRSWKAIAASADGSKLAAVVSGGQIYTSTNYGATWTPRYNNASWTRIASSADGTKLAATVTGNNYVYTSVDSGANWTQTHHLRPAKLDGHRFLPGRHPDWSRVRQWRNLHLDRFWRYWSFLANALPRTAVASSANGSNLVATAQGNFVYVSSNGGVTGPTAPLPAGLVTAPRPAAA